MLNIGYGVIEVTRKCNMQCEHCLRGEAQRKTISDQYIHKFLQLIDNISCLTVTGGEPTLAMEALEQVKHYVQYGRCDVNNFYMVTNGKAINVETLAEWIHGMIFACDDNEISNVGFSFDQFHTQTFNWKQAQKQKRNFQRLEQILCDEYGHYESNIIGKHSDGDFGYNHLLSEGRAKDFGVKDTKVSCFEEDTYNDTICFNDTELYLSCNGIIVAGCDWSYDSIDNNKDIRIAHIDDINCQDDLIEAIRAYNVKAEKRLLQTI